MMSKHQRYFQIYFALDIFFYISCKWNNSKRPGWITVWTRMGLGELVSPPPLLKNNKKNPNKTQNTGILGSQTRYCFVTLCASACVIMSGWKQKFINIILLAYRTISRVHNPQSYCGSQHVKHFSVSYHITFISQNNRYEKLLGIIHHWCKAIEIRFVLCISKQNM